jgi:hypothetical protein
MRRHYTNYFRGLPHVKPYRQRLVTSGSPEDVYTVMEEMEDVFGGEAVEVGAKLDIMKT